MSAAGAGVEVFAWIADAIALVRTTGNEGPMRETANESAMRALQRIRTAVAALVAGREWRPIETAPFNTEVLVWREDSGPFIAKLTTPECVLTDSEMEQYNFPDDFQEWFSDAYGWLEGKERPTHFQPIPPPPGTTGDDHG